MIKIPWAASKIIEELEKSGYEAYVVGGCVRDSLLGKEPADWDICTSAQPEEIKRSMSHYRTLDTGLKYGTITVLADDQKYEVTTYRLDGMYLDHRRPEKVCFISELKEDLRRRDFTMNAMAYHPERGLVDYFSGQRDLENGMICCIGKAEERFREDALRIMRALRFAAVYDYRISPKTARAAEQLKPLLLEIAPERLQAELCRLLCGKAAVRVLAEYASVFCTILPEIKPMIGFQQNNHHHIYDVWQHTLCALDAVPKQLALRLAVLLHDIAKPQCYSEDKDGVGHFKGHPALSAEIAGQILKRLKFSNEIREVIKELILWHDARIQPKQLKRWLNRLGEVQLRRLLLVQRADAAGKEKNSKAIQMAELDLLEKNLDNIIEQQQCFSLKQLKISGKQLLRLGLPEGKRIGEYLNRLLDQVIEGTLENEPVQLIEQAKTWMIAEKIKKNGSKH